MDLSKSTVNKGGQIIRSGPVLDEILVELEEELLKSDISYGIHKFVEDKANWVNN